MKRNFVQFIVATGNPFDGLTLFGPFDQSEDAQAWADDHARNEEWNVVKVEKP